MPCREVGSRLAPHPWKADSDRFAIAFHATRTRWRSSLPPAARSCFRACERASPSSCVRRSSRTISGRLVGCGRTRADARSSGESEREAQRRLLAGSHGRRPDQPLLLARRRSDAIVGHGLLGRETESLARSAGQAVAALRFEPLEPPMSTCREFSARRTGEGHGWVPSSADRGGRVDQRARPPTLAPAAWCRAAGGGQGTTRGAGPRLRDPARNLAAPVHRRYDPQDSPARSATTAPSRCAARPTAARCRAVSRVARAAAAASSAGSGRRSRAPGGRTRPASS